MSPHRARVYVDTSVFGGTQDAEFRAASVDFFEQVKRGRHLVLLLRLTLEELASAPDAVRRVLAELPDGTSIELPEETENEALELAQACITAGVLGESSRADALHVATATVARADLILSWNFRHIVNYERINEYNGINILKGYPGIAIHSPLEMFHDNQDKAV